uniref:Uncharacterized protein n=1 Tax=Trichuris muris TaxID=70415 RepID=A0A5S6QQF7_TRIMR
MEEPRPARNVSNVNRNKFYASSRNMIIPRKKLELGNVVKFIFYWSQQKTRVKFCKTNMGMKKLYAIQWNL